MKKNLAASLLIVTAMTFSCHKQDSAAEQQLAQRKVELDTREEALAGRKSALDEREKALDERQKALDEREKALAQKGKAAVNAATNPADTQVQIPDQTPDPAQAQAVREMIVRQLSPIVPDRSKVMAEKAEKDREIVAREQQLALSQPRLESQRAGGHEMSGGAVFPAPTANSPPPLAVYPQPEATSPPPSPAEEATSPSPSPTPE